MMNPYKKIQLTSDGLSREYKQYFFLAKRQFENREYERALKSLYYSSMVEWLYPNYKYVDEEMESLLDSLSDRIIIEKDFKVDISKKRAVFYNGQLIDGEALTEQYLNYLLENGYKVLFVVFGKERCSKGQTIIKRVNEDENVDVFIPDCNVSYQQRIIDIYNKIVSFSPSIAFLHFLPNDVIGYCVFKRLNGIKRYYIVHNDHTFWLGKNCSDIFLEFRALGKNVAIEKRGIDENRIRILPYYPIVRDIPFKGFPCDVKGKVIGLSGAVLYKYLMDPSLKYFHLIKQLLIENDNFIFFLAGGGKPKDEEIIRSFIKKEKLEGRFYYIGHRNDFYSLIGHIDILFESYPLMGGLTVLFATNQKKAIVGIAQPDTLSGSTEEYLDLVDYRQPRDFDEFYREATRLIRDNSYREKIAESVADNQCTKDCFNRNLTDIINDNYHFTLRRPFVLKLNDKKILEDYINMSGGYHFVLYNNKFSIVHTGPLAKIARIWYSLRFQGITPTVLKLRSILHL